jgi:hypothetical protein
MVNMCVCVPIRYYAQKSEYLTRTMLLRPVCLRVVTKSNSIVCSMHVDASSSKDEFVPEAVASRAHA